MKDGVHALRHEARLDIHIGRPQWSWWLTYFVEMDRERGPDDLLRTEARGFTDLVRRHACTILGVGLRADRAALLLSLAGMLATDMEDLDQTLLAIADWYDLYSPRHVRQENAARMRLEGHHIRRGRPRPQRMADGHDMGLGTRIMRRLRRPKPRHGPLMVHGRRRIPIGTSELVVGIGPSATMQMGIVIDGDLWIIMEIDDRDGRDRSHTPQPTPELVA